ncbi:MAG: hypothetical protein R2708_18080 [Vicinamibacterales bacterium]
MIGPAVHADAYRGQASKVPADPATGTVTTPALRSVLAQLVTRKLAAVLLGVAHHRKPSLPSAIDSPSPTDETASSTRVTLPAAHAPSPQTVAAGC